MQLSGGGGEGGSLIPGCSGLAAATVVYRRVGKRIIRLQI